MPNCALEPEAGGMGDEGGGVAVLDKGTLTAWRLQATSKPRPPSFMKQKIALRYIIRGSKYHPRGLL